MFSAAFSTAQKNGNAYSWSNVNYDYDGADTILLVSNSHQTLDLVIEEIQISSDTSTEVQVHCPAYPTLAGTAVTGVNLNRTSSNVALAEAYADETGNTQANVIARTYVLANVANSPPIQVRLGYHDCVAVDFVTAGTGACVNIIGYYAAH